MPQRGLTSRSCLAGQLSSMLMASKLYQTTERLEIHFEHLRARCASLINFIISKALPCRRES